MFIVLLLMNFNSIKKINSIHNNYMSYNSNINDMMLQFIKQYDKNYFILKGKKNNIIDPINKIFQFNGHIFFTYFINNNNVLEMWTRGGDICRYLGYNAPKKAIMKHVHKKNKMTYKELINLYSHEFQNYVKPPGREMQKATMFINYDGLIEIIIKSQMPNGIKLAKFLDIHMHHKVSRKETDIVDQLNEFCKEAGINSIHQYPIKKNGIIKYSIDYYLTDHNIAIEIDEFNHRNYNVKNEIKRQKYIKKHLKCQFIRCDPDAPDFSMMILIGKIYSMITKQ